MAAHLPLLSVLGYPVAQTRKGRLRASRVPLGPRLTLAAVRPFLYRPARCPWARLSLLPRAPLLWARGEGLSPRFRLLPPSARRVWALTIRTTHHSSLIDACSVFNSSQSDGRLVVAGYGERLVVAGYGERLVVAGYGERLVVAGYGGRLVVAGYGGRLVVAGYGGRLVVAGYGGRLVVAGYGGRLVVAGYGGRLVVARYGGRLVVARYGGRLVVAGYGGRLG
ncbi:hypothetical protein NDU88_001247 [Pleurodeles waltl]|uniref:Uncharacterized protein n=1 Tax=Pleurodeles waltl TaxID=8319 RepID=A0AAV7R7A9_PLEWA|nr:hypothetical protein NDU88_001247 [Pleurodeles waltl]